MLNIAIIVYDYKTTNYLLLSWQINIMTDL